MAIKLNRNQTSRDLIIFEGAKIKYVGGIARYEGILTAHIESLFMNNFIDGNESQNDSPSVNEFYEFMKKWLPHPIEAHGYVVESNRSDYRVSIEGLRLLSCRNNLPLLMVKEFKEMFQHADSLQASQKSLYCWFD